MTLRIRRIATRLALVLAVAAVLPLCGFGLVSLVSLNGSVREMVVAGNLRAAKAAGDEIERYISAHGDLLKALAADLQDTGLRPDQQERVLKNHILQFREFREITLFAPDGASIVTSRVGRPRVRIPSNESARFNGVVMSPVRIDDDLLPTADFGLRLTQGDQPSGWLVGELSLEAMWRTVDAIRIGKQGYALVTDGTGVLLAYGNPDRKALIAQATNLSGRHPLVGAHAPSSPEWREYRTETGEESLAAASRIASLGWTVIVEQPTQEAYASAVRLRQQLSAAIAIALVVVVFAGFVMGRRSLAPIFSLKKATIALADGDLSSRVAVTTNDELGELGTAFNTMADRLVELQENVKRQERQAVFGRLAAGLAHDLAHPVQNIANSVDMLRHPGVDDGAREVFQRTIDREMTALRRLVQDLRDAVRPRPMERVTMDVNGLVGELAESMREEAQRAGVTLDAACDTHAPLIVHADRFALGRVFRNLMANALQATPRGGSVRVVTRRNGAHTEIDVIDTGAGMSADRLAVIFDEFITTKRHGLGLGLAICNRIVEQLDGSIGVRSEIGRGTCFTVRLPIRDGNSVEAAAS